MSKPLLIIALAASALAAGSASAQLLGGGPPSGVSGVIGGPVGGVIDRTVGSVGETVGEVSGPGLSRKQVRSQTNPSQLLDRVNPPLEISLAPAELLAQIRRLRHEQLIKAHKNLLDRDSAGQPVRRAVLVAVDPDPMSLATATRLGFRIAADEQAGELGIRMVTLALPRRMDVRAAFKALNRAAPAMQIDYDHIYEPAGGALLPATGASLAASATVRQGTRIAMIDGGVASHPALARASIEQRGIAGPAQPTGHGTAIVSLLVGSQGSFNGAARGAELFVGDVYGGSPAAGSASVVVKALAWAASKRPSVINVSLIGPANKALARAIAAIRARGIGIVAAVGNDGPAAPPQYPASYPGVIAVTGVDAKDRALREAGRATHLDFAAPGADLVAALPGNGYTPVRGTSFAAPFVAARLAATGSHALLAAEAVPGKGKVGRGIVCRSCRIMPKMVGLKIR